MQPIYEKSTFKIKARAENVRIYRTLTGNQSIPDDRQYWTLCNRQPDAEGSEIVQMEKLGLLQRYQFHGVDRDGDIIAANQLWQPSAHWYHGEWLDVIASCSVFSPALIYLDTTSFADHRIARDMVVATMLQCPPESVLLANVMLNDPRSSRQFDSRELIRGIERHLPRSRLKSWKSSIENYTYSATGKTIMTTFAFYRP